MAQVTFVVSPLGSSVNSTVLWASNGLTKSSLIATLEGGTDSAISMRPWPTSLFPSHAYWAPFPLVTTLKVVEQGEYLLRRSLDARRALDAESVGPGRRKNEKRGDQDGDDDGDFLEH